MPEWDRLSAQVHEVRNRLRVRAALRKGLALALLAAIIGDAALALKVWGFGGSAPLAVVAGGALLVAVTWGVRGARGVSLATAARALDGAVGGAERGNADRIFVAWALDGVAGGFAEAARRDAIRSAATVRARDVVDDPWPQALWLLGGTVLVAMALTVVGPQGTRSLARKAQSSGQGRSLVSRGSLSGTGGHQNPPSQPHEARGRAPTGVRTPASGAAASAAEAAAGGSDAPGGDGPLASRTGSSASAAEENAAQAARTAVEEQRRLREALLSAGAREPVSEGGSRSKSPAMAGQTSGSAAAEARPDAEAPPATDRRLKRLDRGLDDPPAQRPPSAGAGALARAFEQAAAGHGARVPGPAEARTGGAPSTPTPAAAGAETPSAAAATDSKATAAGQDSSAAGANGPSVASARGAGGNETGAGDPATTGAPGKGTSDPSGAPTRDPALAEAGMRIEAHLPEGASAAPRAEVIERGARGGFATPSYLPVYRAYHAAVEETLDQTAVPPARRELVRRYFGLIRPR